MEPKVRAREPGDMIVICGVDEFPSGPWTQELAARFADRMGAELRIVDGGPAADHVAATEETDDGVVLFGHAPPRGAAGVLRPAPCPVAMPPVGVSPGHWDEVLLGVHGNGRSEDAAATAGVLAARLRTELRTFAVPPKQPPAEAI